MTKLAVAGALVLAPAVLGPVYMGSISPVAAQQAAPQFKDPNCPTVDEVEAMLAAQGGSSVELDAKSLLGVTVKQGGKILVANIGGKVVAIGPVIDGCVQPPVGVGEIVPDKGA